MQITAFTDEFDVGFETQSRFEVAPNVGHVHPEARVAEDQNAVGIKEAEAFLNGLDGAGEVRAGLLRLDIGCRETSVGFVQQIQRMFEIAGTLTHLFFEQDGTLELRIGDVLIAVNLLDPAHQ